MAFSPRDGTLITGSADRTVRSWITNTGYLAEKVCEILKRKKVSNLSLDEWLDFVGQEIPYECTCPELPVGEKATCKADDATTFNTREAPKGVTANGQDKQKRHN